MSKLINILKLVRVKHYLKNIIILLPLFFSGDLFSSKLYFVVLGFFSFSFITSVVYIINDLCDIEKDKLHEIKKNRPIASGKITVLESKSIALIIFIISLMLNYFSSNNFYSYILLFSYLLLNIFYSIGLKNIPILDIIILVLGFIIRLSYGSIISDIIISNWLYLTIMSISFYLVLGKRRNEMKKSGLKSRKVLMYYSKEFLDKNMYMCQTLIIVFYSLWTIDINTVNNLGNYMIYTIPLVLILLMKYSMNIEKEEYADPIEVILNDKILLFIGFIYVITLCLTVYIIK